MVIFSFVLSIISALFCWFPVFPIPVCLAALILSIISVNRTFFKKDDKEIKGKGLTIASITISSISTIVSTVVSFILIYVYVFINMLTQTSVQ